MDTCDKRDYSYDDIVDIFSCNICKKLLDNPVAVPCGCLFCKKCFNDELSLEDNENEEESNSNNDNVEDKKYKCPSCSKIFRIKPEISLEFKKFIEKIHDLEEEIINPSIKKMKQYLDEKEISNNHCIEKNELTKLYNRTKINNLFKPDDFKCCICLDLVFKACILPCGHIFGFYCIFKSHGLNFNPNNYCPLCRKEYYSMPSQNAKLHSFFQSYFPDIYKKRFKEDIEEFETILHQNYSSDNEENKEEGAQDPIDENSINSDNPTNNDDIMLEESKDDYVHYGCGCDGCGVYPIIGRRFTCTDCVESIGFDLCNDCFLARDQLINLGKFDQKHDPKTHKFKEVEQVQTAIHLLKQIHPELSEQQIINFLNSHFSNQ
eukprot:TRINITY_DN13174_c0_g1_i1.p1 TRINITY_DN13174_c0_g1~~TRINITY_DN13174_c0_g1_i1.p1  ORF type:complete len:377 (+),score=79.49 TRINITY_DN13174_c0_g1_i1:107-1237(+)